MDKFKVGDKVRIKDHDCTGTHVDEIYTLTLGDANGNGKYALWAWKGGKLDEDNAGCSCQDNWELVKRGRAIKEKPIKFVVVYDEEDEDPYKTFTTEKELKTWLKEARENKDIDFSSVKVFEVKKEYKILTSFKLRAI